MHKTRRKRNVENSDVDNGEKRKRSGRLEMFKKTDLTFATKSDITSFFILLEDKVIAELLSRDNYYKIVDKYLLAMVFVYFRRAKLHMRNFTRLTFFIALFLAHDMEEDEEEIKFEIFPWALGKHWQQKYLKFLILRDKLWSSMDHRAVVSKKCCEDVFSIEPNHYIWKRERSAHHAGGFRSGSGIKYLKTSR